GPCRGRSHIRHVTIQWLVFTPPRRPGFDPPLTDLADYLGLTIETVSRQLYSLRKQGVITVTKNYNILVIKSRALAKISQDSV
ncbi:helix-turn-helix domain-containing protein, partial [Acidiphilium multivorum]|uniref:helix-turn-helix domain-containing protein n=1 Tax=Acidiphilium multivorum TaxID=62140 RepID=UPI001B8D5CCD